MVVDEGIAERFRQALGNRKGLTEKNMMGGTCFLLNGNMIGGADRTKDGIGRLMFRVGKDNDEQASKMTGAEPMIQGGRRMRGFFFVDEVDCDDANLKEWMKIALEFTKGLPPK